jgi:KipI family sensor histidine kinase inhibitor
MPEWTSQGERGLLRSFDGMIADANVAARALAEQLIAGAFPEVVDVVPGARTVLVELRPGAEPSALLIEAIGAANSPDAARAGSLHSVAVTYDGADLEEVARLVGLSNDEVVSLHSSAEYTVAFIGFQPGFPYLIGLPPKLVVSRLDTPRQRVPSGAVAIAGEYTGIYPAATPGGWRLIGRTDETLFDPTTTPPSRFAPGDRVRFVPA